MAEQKNENSDRRNFLGKIARLAAFGGLLGVLLGRVKEPHQSALNLLPGGLPLAAAADGAFENLIVDDTGANSGSLIPGIQFGGGGSGEGISSKRTPGGNQFGLDFFTNSGRVMSLDNAGQVSIPGPLRVNNTLQPTRIAVLAQSNSATALYAITGTNTGVLGLSNSGVGVAGYANGPTAVPLVAGGHFQQTANLQEWRDSASTVLTRVDSTGGLHVGGDVSVEGTGGKLRILNQFGSPLNKFRLDGFQNTLYIIGHSDSGAPVGTKIVLRTAPAGQAEFDRVTIDLNGNVGIGRKPSANRLEVEGKASKTTAGSWLANSDRRIKTDVHDLEDPLDVIGRLHPVWFHYTEEYMGKHPSIGNHEYCNFIAQEYREVFPDSVQDDGDGLLQMDDHNVTPYLVAAVQQLRAEVDEKTKLIDELLARLEVVERSIKPIMAS